MSIAVPREQRLSTPAGDIVWHEWGQRGAGPSLLLLHATGFHGRIWDQVVAHLPEGLHIIAPDQRGHGKSFKPDLLSNWPAEAEDVIALLEETATRPSFVAGHSKGGTVAAFAAAQRPDLFDRLLLIDPVIMPTDSYGTGVDPATIDPSEHPVSRRRNAWTSPAELETHFSTRAPYQSWHPDVLRDYCHHALTPAAAGGGFELACPPRLEASVYMGSILVDPAPACAQVTCPVTVLRGRTGERRSAMDFGISPTRPDLASLFSAGEDHQWSDLSHFIPMEAPERLGQFISGWIQAA